MKRARWQWLWLSLATLLFVILLLLILKWFVGYSLPGLSNEEYNFLHLIFYVLMVVLLIERRWSSRKK